MKDKKKNLNKLVTIKITKIMESMVILVKKNKKKSGIKKIKGINVNEEY